MKRFYILLFCALMIVSLTGCSRSMYQSYVNSGHNLVEKGEYEKAVKFLSTAVTFSPRWPEAYIARGDAYAAMSSSLYDEERQNALKDYQTAYSLDQTNQQARQKMADFYTFAGDNTLANAQESEDPNSFYILAQSYYESALSYNYANADIYGKLADVYILQGMREEALKTLKRGFSSTYDTTLKENMEKLDSILFQEEQERSRTAANDILSKMPYYGNIAVCNMSAEQALSFARLLADGITGAFKGFSGYGKPIYNKSTVFWDEAYSVLGDSAYETDRARVMIGDFDGTGIPYLYVFSSIVDDSSFEVYGWTDGETRRAAGVEAYGGTRKGALTETEFNTVVMKESEIIGNDTLTGQTYRFTNGKAQVSSDWEQAWNGDSMRVRNDDEIKTYTAAEWRAYIEREKNKTYKHDWASLKTTIEKACPLREMIEYLNSYAKAWGASERVETPPEHSEPHKMAEAMLREIFALEHNKQGVNVSRVRVLDLNGDGIDELFIAFDNTFRTDAGQSCRFLICRWDGEKLVQIPGTNNVTQIDLVEEIETGEYGFLSISEGTHYIYTFLTHGEEIYSQSEEYFMTRNGEQSKITISEYQLIQAKYQKMEKIINYTGTVGITNYDSEITNILQKLKKNS